MIKVKISTTETHFLISFKKEFPNIDIKFNTELRKTLANLQYVNNLIHPEIEIPPEQFENGLMFGSSDFTSSGESIDNILDKIFEDFQTISSSENEIDLEDWVGNLDNGTVKYLNLNKPEISYGSTLVLNSDKKWS